MAESIIDRMELTGTAARSVRTLFTYPPGATGGLTLLSLAVVVMPWVGLQRPARVSLLEGRAP